LEAADLAITSSGSMRMSNRAAIPCACQVGTTRRRAHGITVADSSVGMSQPKWKV
jgi:hypothetical protein